MKTKKKQTKVATFEEWFTKTYMRMQHLDIKSLMAWGWSAGIEQAAHELLNPKLAGFSPSDQIRDLKTFCGDRAELTYGGRRSDHPRRFIIVRGPTSLKELVKLAKMMVPDGTIWRKEDLPPGAQVVEAPSNRMTLAGLEKEGPYVIVELPWSLPEVKGRHADGVWIDEIAEKKAFEEPSDLSDFDFLRDLGERLRHVPVMYGVDEGDIDRLKEVATTLALVLGRRVSCKNTIVWEPEKMMPDQEPYTEEERQQRDELVGAAAEAQELWDPDELEDRAARHRERAAMVGLPRVEPYDPNLGGKAAELTRTLSDEDQARLLEVLSTPEGRAKVKDAMLEPLRAFQEAGWKAAAREPIRAFAKERGIPVFESVKDLVASIPAGGVPVPHTDRLGRVHARHIPDEVRDWLMHNTENLIVRVSGDVVCESCQRLYRDHAEFHPTFVLLCDGRVGKT